ncbi:MAG: GAF domain-containing protein [Spirochaetota bacterium]
MISTVPKIDRDSIVIPETVKQTWQEIVDIMADLIQVPAGLIMQLQGPDIKVLMSSDSEGNPYHPGDSEYFEHSGLYCETVIKTQDKLLVPNALKDDHWKHNPDIKLNMISYLGFPIIYPDSTPFGTLCVLDNKTNGYSPKIEKLMLKFRKLIQSDLELIYMNQVLSDSQSRFTDFIKEIQALRGAVPICSNCKSIRDSSGVWHSVEEMMDLGSDVKISHGLCPKCAKRLYPNYNLES